MVDAAWGGAREADAVIVLVEAFKGLDDEAEAILKGTEDLKMPVALALNKVDRIWGAKISPIC